MNINLTNPSLNERLITQAEIQGTTPDNLVQKVLIRCMDLGLIETMRDTTDATEWGSGPIE